MIGFLERMETMQDAFSRTEMLYGSRKMAILQKSHIAVFGCGGVGGYAIEALARMGVGALTIVDNDIISPSNLNRQIIATNLTIGRLKVDVMKERILSINPKCLVTTYDIFYLPENKDCIDFKKFDYVIDCVDTVTAKLLIVTEAISHKVKVISSMGTGNKILPHKLEVADIYKTSVDPLARVMRRELKKRHVKKLKVVYSTEYPLKPISSVESTKRALPASNAFVPATCGLLIASEVIKDLLEEV